MSYDCFSCANLITEIAKSENGNYLYKCKANINACGWVQKLNDLKNQGCSSHKDKPEIFEANLFEVSE